MQEAVYYIYTNILITFGIRNDCYSSRENTLLASTWRMQNIWSISDWKKHDHIDHVLIDKRRHSTIGDARTVGGADCDNDHYIFWLQTYREREGDCQLNGQGRRWIRRYLISEDKWWGRWSASQICLQLWKTWMMMMMMMMDIDRTWKIMIK
jgi:hypothetical protein